MDGRAKALMDRKVVGASHYLFVYLSACLLLKLVQVVKLVKLVKFDSLAKWVTPLLASCETARKKIRLLRIVALPLWRLYHHWTVSHWRHKCTEPWKSWRWISFQSNLPRVLTTAKTSMSLHVRFFGCWLWWPKTREPRNATQNTIVRPTYMISLTYLYIYEKTL